MLAALVLVFQSFGYDLDRKTGHIIQNGLIFVDSHPESSTIYLNGKESGKTSTRLTVPAGNYNVELRRDGYRTWKRSFTLESESIERLTYPTLFPEKLTTDQQQQFTGSATLATSSPDRHWIVVGQPDSLTSFSVFDANNPKQAAASISLPAEVLTASTAPQSVQLVEWSNDNRHVLLQHTFGDASEFIMLDRETPASSVNLNKALNVTSTKVTLRDKKYDQLLLYDGKTKALSTGDVKTKTMAPYLANVLEYKSYGSDTMLYAAPNAKDAAKTDIRLRQGDKDSLIHTYATAVNFLLDIAKFDNHWYMVVSPAAEGKVYIFKDPLSQTNPAGTTPTALTSLIMTDPNQLSFSATTQFIMVQSGKRFAVYDAEANRRYYYELNVAPVNGEKAHWMDGDRLLLSNQGKVSVFDFDGSNLQTLAPIAAGTTPLFDRDYTRLYTIAPLASDATKSALTRTNLKLNL